jgi:hypothetical protein
VIYAAAVSEAARETLGVEPTQDDGTRLSRTRVWDEAARPRRPAPPAGAAYTRAGRATSRHLIQIHDMLRDGLVSAGEARSQLNEMTMRQNNWTMGAYCQSYCRVVTHHHFAEDAMVFPHLRARESGLGQVLDRLSEEHVVIHEVLDAVDRALVAYIAQPADHTQHQEAVDLLTDTLLSHLAYEESQLLEPLARYGFYDSPF